MAFFVESTFDLEIGSLESKAAELKEHIQREWGLPTNNSGMPSLYPKSESNMCAVHLSFQIINLKRHFELHKI